jgi:hypothetical protein
LRSVQPLAAAPPGRTRVDLRFSESTVGGAVLGNPASAAHHWGQVLGTHGRSSREAQGPSRESSAQGRNDPNCRESALVYGLLTAVLGLGYAAGSLVFVLVAGTGADPPSWLVAAATLAAAAIFRPARRYPGRGGSPLQPPQVQRRPDHPVVLHLPARPGRPRHPLQRAAGGRGPDHGANPGLGLASSFPTRLLGHSSQWGTAYPLGLLRITPDLRLQAVEASIVAVLLSPR